MAAAVAVAVRDGVGTAVCIELWASPPVPHGCVAASGVGLALGAGAAAGAQPVTRMSAAAAAADGRRIAIGLQLGE